VRSIINTPSALSLRLFSRVHVGAGRVEGDADLVFFHMGEQAVDAFGGGLEPHLAGTREPFGSRVDADHPYGFEHAAAFEFVEQIGADVAGADHGAADLLHGFPLQSMKESTPSCRFGGSGING